MENKTLSDDLAQLHTSHKQLQLEKEVLDTQLGTLQPAHAELRQLYDSTISELQTTKAALQKAQEARVHAEVSSAAVSCTKLTCGAFNATRCLSSNQ